MAIAAVPELETRLCGNCKKDIPAVNFIIHEIHCSRNIQVCRRCGEPVPRSEMNHHMEAEHVQVTCKCKMKIENSLLKDHQALACPLRPAPCPFCAMELPFSKLQEHEAFCGARTEACGACGRNVMLRDREEHPRVCGTEAKGRRGGQRPGSEDEDARVRLGRGPARLGSEHQLGLWERNEAPHSLLHEEWDADLDYVLALSLQTENHPPKATAAEAASGFWATKEPELSACLSDTDQANSLSCDSPVSFSRPNHIKSDEVTMLPCEFCEELYPADDLILHQTGCNPASAFASFSKRSSSAPPRECDDWRALSSKSSRSLSSSQPQAAQAEGNVKIPCEFCGMQLEEEMLFPHQLCVWQPLPERRPAPGQAQRRSSRAGAASRGTEGLGQQQPSSARGTRSLSDAAATWDSAPSPLVRGSAAPTPPGQPRKGGGSQGRAKNRAATGSARGTTAPGRPPRDLHSGTLTSSCSRASPAQPSTHPEGRRGRGLAAVAPQPRSTEVKAQSAASRRPEK
ncbi:TRAF-type zinc finger domain-containing protein 1 isoform X2 [Colius striatus]|uniref:TRAF-type zinc finger domain-containing protein 1 isoform X2 n=1 Tax=Colius striatus TaxID=57412 RepID=UPI002B1D5320|nr:TRAF-type zinc finger domain-containing protein 1 isoform X2 [Colius striatus]